MVSINRHILIVVLCALLPLLAVAIALAVVLMRDARHATERELQESAQRLSQAVDAELQRSFAALQALSRSESLRRGDLQAFHSEASDVRRGLGLWDNVLVLSPSAEHLLNLMRPYGTVLPPVPQPEGTLQAARTKQPYVSNALKGRLETDWLMYIAYPAVFDGEVRYVIGVTLHSKYWSRWLRERTAQGRISAIIDREHVILARSQDAERLVGQQIQPWYRERLAAQASGQVRGHGVLESDVVVAFHQSPLSSWRVNVLTSGAVLDAPVGRTMLFVSLALLIALAIAVGLSLSRAAVLTRGVRSLHDALENLRSARRLSPLASPVAEVQAAMVAAQRTADALAAREERLERAQQAARLGLWEWDLRANAMEWSPGIYRLLGAVPGSLAPALEALLDRVAGADRERVRRAFECAAQRPGPFSEEFRLERLDGSTLWVACAGAVEVDERGCALRMQGVSFDITARKEAEEQLRRSEEKFRAIAHAAPAIVWITDHRGLVFTNERWTEYTGQPLEAALGQGWTACVHPDDNTRLLPYRARCRETGQPYEGEVRYRRQDGEYRWHAFRALRAPGTDGTAEQWFGISVDIHDAKVAQEALRAADQRKDEFLATLAHELRNPLAPIRNALQLLQLTPMVDPTLRAAQDVMDRQVTHMVRLIDDLLDVSRITRGKLELRREPVELGRVVEQALETARPNMSQKLTVSLPDEPVRLDADPVRLSQILANLLNNAAKFTPKNGHIELVARMEAGRAVIRVRDDGIGIAPDQLPRLFQMFTQAGSPLDRASGGLGIGLALARSLVELHHGSIQARSEGLGRGSEFIVSLPVLTLSDAAALPPLSARKPYNGAVRRVLVVDDVKDNASSLAALLRVDGNAVEIAHDGLEAVERAAAFKPDLVLLDLGLPRLSGFEACEVMRRQPWGKGLVIVALTGWGNDEDRRRTREAGFDAHLVKPVQYETLRELLASPLMV